MKQPRSSDLKIDKRGTQKMREQMSKSPKIKITINFDKDLLDEIKRMAKEAGAPYQTLLNKILKDAMIVKRNENDRLGQLEKEVEKIKKKLAS